MHLEELKTEYTGQELPSVAECYFNAGLSLLKSGQLDKARAAFASALDEDKEWAEPCLCAGLLDLVLGRPAQARPLLEAARRLDAQNGLAAEALGTACLGLGYPKEAERQFEEARGLGRNIPAQAS
jgi:tetratricopeptide (TPR) repeat protein